MADTGQEKIKRTYTIMSCELGNGRWFAFAPSFRNIRVVAQSQEVAESRVMEEVSETVVNMKQMGKSLPLAGPIRMRSLAIELPAADQQAA